MGVAVPAIDPQSHLPLSRNPTYRWVHPYYNNTAVMEAVAEGGPVAVAIDATSKLFHYQ